MKKILTLIVLFGITLNSYSQKTESYTERFQTSDGISGYVRFKTQPTAVGRAYLLVKNKEVVIERVVSQKGYAAGNMKDFPLTLPHHSNGFFSVNGTATMDIGGYTARGDFNGSGSNLEVHFSKNDKDNHNKLQKKTGINYWEQTGEVSYLSISNVTGPALREVRSAMARHENKLKRIKEEKEKAELVKLKEIENARLAKIKEEKRLAELEKEKLLKKEQEDKEWKEKLKRLEEANNKIEADKTLVQQKDKKLEYEKKKKENQERLDKEYKERKDKITEIENNSNNNVKQLNINSKKSEAYFKNKLSDPNLDPEVKAMYKDAYLWGRKERFKLLQNEYKRLEEKKKNEGKLPYAIAPNYGILPETDATLNQKSINLYFDNKAKSARSQSIEYFKSQKFQNDVQTIARLFEVDPEKQRERQQNRYENWKFRMWRNKEHAKNKKATLKEEIMSDFSAEGLAVKKNKRGWYGFVNKEGKWIIKPKYIIAEPFKNGKSKVTNKIGKTYYINLKGKKL